ncbi:Uncharacterised protein [Amycolatopsis camponoti]|uniref:Uncharacterized protein n=1 Tax=Amycolatopsis camponoti TaxID=2606593 RepID=A0A6I8LP87_9PSEU|nr:Uncharacterised protein [Amycolatopsis camponoti]
MCMTHSKREAAPRQCTRARSKFSTAGTHVSFTHVSRELTGPVDREVRSLSGAR